MRIIDAGPSCGEPESGDSTAASGPAVRFGHRPRILRANIPRGLPLEMNPLPDCLASTFSVRVSRLSNQSASGRARVSPRLPATPCAIASGALFLALVLGCAAVQAGTPEGYEAGRRGDYATALREFQPAAEKGDRDAQLALADMYLRGYGVA